LRSRASDRPAFCRLDLLVSSDGFGDIGHQDGQRVDDVELMRCHRRFPARLEGLFSQVASINSGDEFSHELPVGRGQEIGGELP
jgi:hypothetical protein